MEPEERDSLPSINLQDSSMEIGDNSRDIEVGSEIVSGKRKLTSDVWAHFNRIKVDRCQYGACKYCGIKLKAPSKNGTSSLGKHYNLSCKKKPGGSGVCQSPSMANKKVVGSQEHKTLNEEKTRRELAMMVVLHNYPLSIVDHVGFRRFIASFKSSFQVMSRNTLKNDIMKIYSNERVKCYNLLEKLKCRIAITTDMWTSSNNKKGFMAITGHYIDDSWVLQSCILSNIKVKLDEWVKSPNWIVQDMAKKMLEKYDKYWETCHIMMGVAAVLDPRYKMILVEFYFRKIYGEQSQTKIDEIRHNCYELLSDYQSRATTRSDSSSTRGSLGSMIRGGVSSVTDASADDSLEEYDLFAASRFADTIVIISSLRPPLLLRRRCCSLYSVYTHTIIIIIIMPRTTTVESGGCPPLRALTLDVLGLVKVIEAQKNGSAAKMVERWGDPDFTKSVVATSILDRHSNPLLSIARKCGSIDIMSAINGDLRGHIPNLCQAESSPEDDVITGLHLFKNHQSESSSRSCKLLTCTSKGHASIASIEFSRSPAESILDPSPTKWNVCGQGNILCSKVDESENYALCGGKGVEVNVWDLEKCVKIWTAKSPPKNSLGIFTPTWFTSATFLSKDDHRKFVAGTESHQVRLYDISAQRRPVMSIDFRETPIKAISEDLDGHTIYIGNGSGDLASIDMRTGKLLGCFLGKCSGSIRSIARHPDLPIIASCGLDSYLRIWDIKSRQLLSAVFLKQHLTSVLFDSHFQNTEVAGSAPEPQNISTVDIAEQDAKPAKRKKVSKEHSGIKKVKSKKSSKKLQDQED
ncbi:hypothetical protein BUALT_Bualt02G0087800 [Buddleja alternifolia]|uniref:BED-type domain-containing protein n=1 Tax=Buddleja alternifolia TaxID=168488 RepID=A0AAV6XZ40_9LAMI|nr:hypothetical protein BUALT_Bualt02G0087800 [Buddleja alternifolia]